MATIFRVTSKGVKYLQNIVSPFQTTANIKKTQNAMVKLNPNPRVEPDSSFSVGDHIDPNSNSDSISMFDASRYFDLLTPEFYYLLQKRGVLKSNKKPYPEYFNMFAGSVDSIKLSYFDEIKKRMS